MTFFEGEQVIDRLDSCGLILTTHRIREGSEREFTSLMLEQICSIAVERVAKTWLLVIGIAGIAGTAIAAEYQRIEVGSALALSVVGLVLILWYGLTRFRVVQIASPRASIFVRIPRRNAQSVLRLIDAIEFAKSERMKVLCETRIS